MNPSKKSLNITDYKMLKMAISEQFKSLNLNPKKMRNLCTDEVGGVEMKKMKKKHILQFEK